MEFKIWDKCSCGCGDRIFLVFKSKPFQFRWFMDTGYWFLYVHFGKRYFRFSEVGYMSGIIKEGNVKNGSQSSK